MDKLKVHHGKMAAGWLSEHKDEIELFFTSPYSPEINPDEYLNHSLKQNVCTGICRRTNTAGYKGGIIRGIGRSRTNVE